MFFKICTLKNFAIFWNKKRLKTEVFSFEKFLRTFFYRTTLVAAFAFFIVIKQAFHKGVNLNRFLKKCTCHDDLTKTLCNCLCSSSCDSASLIRNIGNSWAENCFTDNWTADTIHGFSDSVPFIKIHDCLLGYAKIWATFHSYPSDTRQLQCVDVNNPLQTVLMHVYTVYTYSDCMINQLLYCWKMI